MKNSGNRSAIGDDELLRLREEGLTYEAIATLAGISRQGVHDRLRRLRTRQKGTKTSPRFTTGPAVEDAALLRNYKGLMTVRAWNALVCWFGTDKEPTVGDLRALATGLMRIPNFGAKSYKEICELFGMTCKDSSHAVLRAYAQASRLKRRKALDDAQAAYATRRARFRGLNSD
jgi:hypothetical protein